MKSNSVKTLVTKKIPNSSVLRGYMYIPQGNNCEGIKWLCEIPHIEHSDIFDGRKVIDYSNMRTFTKSAKGKIQFYKFENLFFKKVDLLGCCFKGCEFVNCEFYDCTVSETSIKACTFMNCTICSDVKNSVIKDSFFNHSHFTQMLYNNNTVTNNIFYEDTFLRIGVHQNTIKENEMESCSFSNVIQHDTNICSGNKVVRPFFQSTCRAGVEENYYRLSILNNLCGIA